MVLDLAGDLPPGILGDLRDLNPADLTRRINAIQAQLIGHARAKTLALRDAS